MITNNNDFVYLIHCPSNSLNNGGAETLHQLAFHLKKNNLKVFVNYFPQIDDDLIPEKLLRYNIIKKKFEDNNNTIHIIPEVETSRTKLIKKGRCIIYWLSVDSYFQRNADKPFWKNWNYYRKSMNKRVFLFNLRKYTHLANSHYAHDFLESKNIKSTILKGYISEFYDGKFELSKKKNIILFNPTKDHIHYKKIMDQFPEYEFKALAKMSSHQIKNYYSNSKIFMDLGIHPGRERMPREAAVMGCILIVAKRGSTLNNFDVPINDLYKIDLSKKNSYEKIGKLISEIFNNYENHLKDFEMYRKQVSYNNDIINFNEKIISFTQDINKRS